MSLVNLSPDICTDIVNQGSHILNLLIASPSITKVNTFSRRLPGAPFPSQKSRPPHLSQHPSLDLLAHPSIATTYPLLLFLRHHPIRSQLTDQYKTEHDTHLGLARAARQAGAEVFILVSSPSENPQSWILYARIKGEIEEGIKAMRFKRTVILCPGL